MVSRNRKIARRIGQAVANDVLDTSGAISAGAGVTVYATVDDLPTTGLTAGDQGFVSGSNRLYISNGTGWYSIALINTAPNITSDHDSSYNLLYNTPLNISVAATDPEGLNLNYSYNTSDSIGSVATITNDSSQFTITPSSNYAVEGSFSLAFRASDGVNIATAGTSTFTLANQAPSLSGNSSSYILSDDGLTATIITLTSVDPEGQPITYSATGDSGFNSIATVAQGTGEAYAIASAAILSGTYTVTSYAGGLTFKPDGTKMYYAGTNNDRVQQFDLSTAWDLSTASYDNNFSVQSQALNLTDVKFNNDGTKMYAADRAGTTDNTIYQYSLTTAWDATTASYANKSYDFGSVLTGDELNCFVFNADGSAVYLAEHSPNRKIYQFTLSTDFDISTATYSNKSLDFASEAVGRPYFQFTNDGTKLFMINTFHTSGFVGKIYEYSLTTAYDISTASYTNVNYAPSGITTGRSALAFKPDGSKMFIMGTDNHTTISQFNLPVYNTNAFIATPKNETQAPGGGTGNLTFTASDGVKSTNAASSFSLTFTLEWSDGTVSISQQTPQNGYSYMGMECAIDSSGYHGFTGGYNYNYSSYTRAGFAATYDIGYNVSGDLTYCQQDHYFHSGTNNGSPQAEGNFGRSVDMDRSGDFAIVGEPGRTVSSNSGAGQALIYRRDLSNNDDTFQNQISAYIYSGWGYNQNDYVGTGVAMSGDARVVAISTGSNSSAPGRYNLVTAYNVFEGSNFGHQYNAHSSYITGPSNRSKFFGCSRNGSVGSIDLDYHGQTLSVGDPGYTNTYGNQGRVHIYTRSGGTTHPTSANGGSSVSWSLQASILSNSPTEYESFGNSTALSDDGNVLAVGCPFPNAYAYSGNERQEGSIQIFTRSGTTWSYSTTLSANTGVSYGGMGVGLAISKDGTVVVAGAPESAAANDNINDQHGKVYVFRNTGGTWSLEATLTGNSSGINLGESVALSGNGEIILAGAAYAYSNRGGLFAHQIG